MLLQKLILFPLPLLNFLKLMTVIFVQVQKERFQIKISFKGMKYMSTLRLIGKFYFYDAWKKLQQPYEDSIWLFFSFQF